MPGNSSENIECTNYIHIMSILNAPLSLGSHNFFMYIIKYCVARSVIDGAYGSLGQFERGSTPTWVESDGPLMSKVHFQYPLMPCSSFTVLAVVNILFWKVTSKYAPSFLSVLLWYEPSLAEWMWQWMWLFLTVCNVYILEINLSCTKYHQAGVH